MLLVPGLLDLLIQLGMNNYDLAKYADLFQMFLLYHSFYNEPSKKQSENYFQFYHITLELSENL